MNRSINRGALIGSAFLLSAAGAAGTEPTAPENTAPRDALSPATPAAQRSQARQSAIARARQALQASGIDAAALAVKSIEPMTWSDSSLGCRQPGQSYLQVVTSGYRVEFADPPNAKLHAVHVAGSRAAICTSTADSPAPLGHAPLLVRNIDAMIQKAKDSLAASLHVPVAQIHTVRFTPQVWPDTSLGCPSQSQAVAAGCQVLRLTSSTTAANSRFILICTASSPALRSNQNKNEARQSVWPRLSHST